METYGKQNIIKREYLNLKSRFSINPYTEEQLNNKGLSLYIPKLNKLRVAFGIVGLVILLITPFTNFLSIFLIRWALA